MRQYDLAELLRQFGKFGRVLWEGCHGIDEHAVSPDRLPKSVGVEKTLAADIHHWHECKGLVEHLYQELELRLRRLKPDLHIAPVMA
ncbi:MAG: DinB/UmuC family translesion DNA polymerase [Candidatus Malihini olakiniferum]